MRFPSLPCCLAVALIGPACVASQAEALADPTRPPAALFAPPAAAGAQVAVRPAAPAVPHVQSIRLPAAGTPSALVDNHLVTLGDKVGGRTVVAIDAAGLQLRDAQGRVGRLPLIDAAVVVKQTLPNAGAQAPAHVATLAEGQQP